MDKWIEDLFQNSLDHHPDYYTCEELQERVRAAHAAHCKPLTNELAERIMLELLDAVCGEGGDWPGNEKVKAIILRVRDGEAKGESE